jgi:uncharacterized Tic20 family protein
MNDEDAPAGGGPGSDDRNLAVLAHLSGILFSFIGGLVIWLVKKDSEYVSDQAREALNFQITIVGAQIISGLLVTVGIGCLMLPAVLITNLVFCVLAAVACSRGERYRYPVCIRMIS